MKDQVVNQRERMTTIEKENLEQSKQIYVLN